MTFALAFAPRDKLSASISEYNIHPDFCVSLGAGTLLVFSPADDLFFTHEAWFEDTVSGTHRLAFVFRWLTLTRTFYEGTSKMKLTPDLKVKQSERIKKKARRRASERRANLRRH
jgi:hypothetical protein